MKPITIREFFVFWLTPPVSAYRKPGILDYFIWYAMMLLSGLFGWFVLAPIVLPR